MPNTDALNRTVFISDNLPFLKSLDSESVDLVVIDPPFGKRQTFTGRLKPPLTDAELGHEYDLLSSWGVQNEADAYEMGLEFPDQSGVTASFREIWDFRYQVTEADWEMLESVCPAARYLIEATRYTHSDGTAGYIAFMTMRMIEIHRILKPTGSVYLHCDHEANAYLRQMMDAIFGNGEGGKAGFRNEITWKRAPGRGQGKHWGNTTDTILFYSKSDEYAWSNLYSRPEKKSGSTRVPLDAAELRFGKSGDEWNGYNPSDIGRHWAVPKIGRLAKWIEENKIPNYSTISDPHDRLDALQDAGLIEWSENGRPAISRPSDADQGAKLNNLWVDVKLLSPKSQERTGYPTQKPQALAHRIIEASSNPGDLVLDCFAGCAYVPVAAELTGRRWIACDMSPRAWTVVRRQFEKQPDLRIVTEGERVGAMQAGLGDERIIRVRGPRGLPQRETNGQQQPLGVRTLKPIQFRQRAVETGAEIWQAFVDEWGPACWYCGNEMDEDRRLLHLDHIEPNARDGSNDDCWNRALACAPCNSDKSDQMTVEQAIDKALKEGRISTVRLRDEQMDRFAVRHKWADERWQVVKPQKLDL